MARHPVTRASTLALFAMFPLGILGCAHDAPVQTASVCGNVFEIVHGAKKNVANAFVFVTDKTGNGERRSLDAKGRYSATGLTPGPITVLAQTAGGSTVTCSVAPGAAAQIDMSVTFHDYKIRKLTCPAPTKTPDCLETKAG